ncbi:D-amino-acid oxidase [Microdochium nivale]|nr:D-amino-acid oxidase [Microdochium nivale]
MAIDNSTDVLPRSAIAVIGAGIIGLTSALSIQSALGRTHDVVIVAREWPHAVAGAPTGTSADYASMWAGAHVRPIPVNGDGQLAREAAWLKHTCEELGRQAASEPWIGITRLRGREYLETPPDAYVKQTAESFLRESGLSGYRQLPVSEVPEGVKVGFEYDTYCINSPLYCANLLRKFLLRGGKTVARQLASEADASAVCENVRLVVNASGAGFGDPGCFPTRGQTVLTNLTGITETITRQNADGTWSFVIPRFLGGGTVIGGTKEPGSWDLAPSRAARERLLQGAQKLQPGLLARTEEAEGGGREPLCVIADIVGRRPTRRGGMRVECQEHVSADIPSAGGVGGHSSKTVGSQLQDAGLPIVHAYGAGGRGFEISWGVAQEVAELVSRRLGFVSEVDGRVGEKCKALL